ncbi:MAG: mercury transporter, partial [Paracoccus sp. (in: a-proteobacteria)]
MAETTTEAEVPSLEERQASDRKAWASTGGALAGALAMTSCCILPLVLVSFGVTGVFIAQLGALYAYKWYTFALSAAFLGYGFYKAY